MYIHNLHVSKYTVFMSSKVKETKLCIYVTYNNNKKQ